MAEDIKKTGAAEEAAPEEEIKETTNSTGDTEEAEAEAETSEEPAESGQEEEPENEDPSADPEEAPDDGKKKKGFFGKKKEKTDKKDEMIADLRDKLTRQMAEFDNYRKRTEKEKAANFIIGARDVLEKILPIVDNFERGLADADLSDPFADGMDKIYRQLMTVLTDLGVTPMDAAGKPFDPELHNAVMHVEDEEAGENTVVEEFQKGYMYKDQVLRHSMVKVAN